MSEVSVQTLIQEACQKLQTTAALMNVKLERKVSSVQSLEEIVGALRESGNNQALAGATFMIGAYLGEIIRAAAGGAWEKNQAGELSLLLNGASYHPIEKVRKFAADPAGGDSLAFFARAVIATQAQQGVQRDGFAAR